jgi:low affinity Fe/Cu permease
MLKKLIISIILLVTTLPSISQTVTSDSLICLPKRYLVQAIQDIEAGDLATKQLILEQKIQKTLRDQLSLKDSVITTYQEKQNTFETEIGLLDQTISAKDDQIELQKKLAKKYKRQRNGILAGAGSAIVLFLVLILN